jgi:hypothetical protein
MPDVKLRSACEMMDAAIKQMERDIINKERQIRSNIQLIDRLESQPNPDTALIGELKRLNDRLQNEIDSDRPQLGAFQEEFSASCRG